jgi:integrase
MATEDNQNTIEQRLEAIDALIDFLPNAQRERLARILPIEDINILKNLAKQQVSKNSLRALASDLGYLQAWANAAIGSDLPWPASNSLIFKFIDHHLWDPAQKEIDANHGMPEYVCDKLLSQGLLAGVEAHAPATVKRRLSSWSKLHRCKAIENPFASAIVKAALKEAIGNHEKYLGSEDKKAITLDIFDKMLATCDEQVPSVSKTKFLTNRRDRALLLYIFETGGRRRSEAANLKIDAILKNQPLPSNSKDIHSSKAPSMTIKLDSDEARDFEGDQVVVISGRSVIALNNWIEAAGIIGGAVFRSIDKWGNIGRRAITPRAVNDVVKKRIEQAGLNPTEFSSHSLRVGYLKEAANQGIPLLQAMQKSRHRSITQAARYYKGVTQKD